MLKRRAVFANPTGLMHASATHQARIDEWLAEIARLPPRKQKNWKGRLCDKWIVR